MKWLSEWTPLFYFLIAADDSIEDFDKKVGCGLHIIYVQI